MLVSMDFIFPFSLFLLFEGQMPIVFVKQLMTHLARVSTYGEKILGVERVALHSQDLARVALRSIDSILD